MDENKNGRPVNVVIALSLMPCAALMAIDGAARRLRRRAMQLFPAVLTLGGLCIAAIIFLVRSIVKKEQPSLLQFLPPVLWLMLAKPLFI